MLPNAAALPPDAPRYAIRFAGDRFRYPGLWEDVLAGLDLTIPAGHSLAIVGLNGAGKTTLVNLLGRLYEPHAGTICVDDIGLHARCVSLAAPGHHRPPGLRPIPALGAR